ncbi:MAG: glycosyltransferase, partial [Proteobacteria bacterium]|nr:glycosyltransferase [Pseudomonadota bacterium]
MTTASKTHLVLIPAFNPGPLLFDTVRAARQHWNPVWVVVDGSTDGTTAELLRMQARDPGLVVILRPVNGGKGAAVLTGIEQAGSRGFTH